MALSYLCTADLIQPATEQGITAVMALFFVLSVMLHADTGQSYDNCHSASASPASDGH